MTSGEHPVAELCEQGFRLSGAGAPELAVGEIVSGDVVFEDGERVRIAGKVQRHVDDEAVIALQWGIPMPRIIAEQRRVIRLGSDKSPEPRVES
jgi:hypothetical protein